MKMTILSPGPLTTVQDGGRHGYLSTGFSPSGAMDASSLRLANLLVGNHPEEGALEMTLGGITARFDEDVTVAVTGADLSPRINGTEAKMNATLFLKAGDELSLGMAKSGLRGYLAVSGGFDLPLVMGSLSTNLKCAVGGFQGRKLAAGDEIPLKGGVLSPLREFSLSSLEESVLAVHVMLGPQDDAFTSRGIKTFFNTVYTVSPQSDRMGLRLEGEAVESHHGVDIISDGIVTGSVQIPASGKPILMMADRQTIGGYAKIATVIQSDLPRLAQAKPGTKLRFHAVSRAMALLEWKANAMKWKRLEAKFPPSFGKERYE